MTFSIIQKSQLEGALRIDAEYYQPEFLELAKILRGKKSNFLKKLVDSIHRGKQPIYDPNGSIIALKSVYLRNDFINDSGDEFVNNKFYNSNPRSQIHKNDVLLNSTGVGTLGRSNYFYLNKKAVADGHITIIRPKEKLNPIYLDVFFKTKYGQFQINRLYSGSSGQIEIYPDNIELIEIFLPSKYKQDEVVKLCELAHKKELNSKSLYQQAKDLLLEELGLKDFKIDDSLYNIVNLSDVQSASRMDAEHFQKKYEELIKILKKRESSLLGDLVEMKKGIEPGSEEYLDEGKQFIRVSSISKFGINDNALKYLSEELYNNLKNDFEPKPGEILLTKDATPGIACVVGDKIEGIVSGGILRLSLKTKKIEDEYLSLCLNSIIGEWQAERDAGGSIIKHWKPEQIRNVVIPILPQKIQQKISSLVRESFEARKKATELLEEAKRRVEDLIEKGGDK